MGSHTRASMKYEFNASAALMVILCLGSISGGHLAEGENMKVFLPGSGVSLYWRGELATIPSRVLMVQLAQLRRRTTTRNISAGTTMRKKSQDRNGAPERKETTAGFYGGHNPSGRIRILKF